MHELLDWKHFRSPIEQSDLQVSICITFILFCGSHIVLVICLTGRATALGSL